ncbi:MULTISPECIES: hypothetical protein [Ancylomarina]|uniref:hypothetical protein n=1 Tax=Ancylomarina TaxID=1970195 RepID=UPI0012E11895|nr:hypothetical protein [Ancylomarina euxinus]MBI9035470.1 hypothetical protein [Bacteroidales bacterium]MCZ4693887.1 hypothetical protein [Ancylomarina euxinus]MUP14693.1 hypothetical protein [Ancylomarina euxinus]
MAKNDDKKTFTPEGKTELLNSFGEGLNDKSMRILEYFKNSGKDLNKVLEKAYKFRKAC